MRLKDLMTARTNLLKQKGSIVEYLRELALFTDKAMQNMMRETHKSALEGLKKSIAEVEEQISNIMADPAVAPNYGLITSVPGIGQWTALYILTRTNNFAGEISGKQLTSYAGVVPFEHTSSISINGRNRVHKMTDKDLKKMLHLYALSSIKYHPGLEIILNGKGTRARTQ